MPYDWSQFTLRINIKAYGTNVFDSWSKPGNLEKWFLADAVFTNTAGHIRAKDDHIQAGDSYQWRWLGHPDTLIETGKVLMTDGKSQLKFTFAGDCLVTITIKVEDGEIIAELLQENIPTDENARVDIHRNCSIGWSFYLTNLKSILEGGIDLRNRNAGLHHLLNA